MSTPTSPDDEVLVRQAQDGDRRAWVLLYERYAAEIYGYAYNQLGTVQDAEDVTSEVFLRLVGHLGGYRGQARFRTWLYAIARNQVRDHWRARTRQPQTVELEPSRTAGPGPAAEPRGAARSTALGRGVLAAMPPNYRQVLELRILEGRSVRDSADEMGITENHVKVLLHRALRRAAQVADRLVEADNDKPEA